MYVHQQQRQAESNGEALARAGWEELTPGTRVEVRTGSGRIGHGTVDAVMPDGSVIWFWLDGRLGRKLAHVSGSTLVRPVV